MLKWGRSLKAIALGSWNISFLFVCFGFFGGFFVLSFCKVRALRAPQDVLLLGKVTAGGVFVDLCC